MIVLKDKETIPVFLASDMNYLPYLSIAVQSIADHISDGRKYHIYVLTDNIDESSFVPIKKYAKENLTIDLIDVTEKIQSIRKKVPLRDYYSVSIYFRLFIPSLFPQYDKAIYLDSDIVVNCDLAEIFDVQLKNNYLAAVLDEVIWSSKEFTYYARNALGVTESEYFNSGVLLMNLEKFRKNNIEEDFYHYITTYNFGTVAPDQDYLNVTCHGSVVYLDGAYNQMPMNDRADETKLKIIHYNMYMKPWRYKDTMYGEYFWNYAKDNPCYEYLLDQQENYSDENKINDKKAYNKLMDMALKIADSDNNYKKTILNYKIKAENNRKKIKRIIINKQVAKKNRIAQVG